MTGARCVDHADKVTIKGSAFDPTTTQPNRVNQPVAIWRQCTPDEQAAPPCSNPDFTRRPGNFSPIETQGCRHQVIQSHALIRRISASYRDLPMTESVTLAPQTISVAVFAALAGLSAPLAYRQIRESGIPIERDDHNRIRILIGVAERVLGRGHIWPDEIEAARLAARAKLKASRSRSTTVEELSGEDAAEIGAAIRQMAGVTDDMDDLDDYGPPPPVSADARAAQAIIQRRQRRALERHGRAPQKGDPVHPNVREAQRRKLAEANERRLAKNMAKVDGRKQFKGRPWRPSDGICATGPRKPVEATP